MIDSSFVFTNCLGRSEGSTYRFTATLFICGGDDAFPWLAARSSALGVFRGNWPFIISLFWVVRMFIVLLCASVELGRGGVSAPVIVAALFIYGRVMPLME